MSIDAIQKTLYKRHQLQSSPFLIPPPAFHPKVVPKLIGVAIPSLSNAVFADMLRGICDLAASAGYQVLIVDTNYSAKEEEKMVQALLEQPLEAMIVTGGEQTQRCRDFLRAADIPVVQVMELLHNPIDMNVGISQWQAGYDVAQHFIEEGYSRIGFVGAQLDMRARHRLQGFITALEEQGKYRENFIVNTPEPSSVGTGSQLFNNLMEATKGMIEAVFCANDDLALGVLFESMRQGIKVPDDLAICGFNNIEAARYSYPSLTSVSINRYDMGVKSAKMIIERLKGESAAPKVVDLGYEIIKRQSTTMM
jgi:LacI family transcriptional regulator, gluconate utilization system Gnt-I transcriptional repressor